MNKLDKIDKGLVFEGKKIELQAELKELDNSIDNLVEEVTSYSLRSTKQKKRINKLEKIVIVIMSLLVIAAAIVFFGTFFGYFTGNGNLFICGILLMCMFITSWVFIDGCRE